MRHLLVFFYFYYFSILKIKRVQTAFPIIPTCSVKENKYKGTLFYSESINYCDNNGKTEDSTNL
jgi:hypothetical protein